MSKTHPNVSFPLFRNRFCNFYQIDNYMYFLCKTLTNDELLQGFTTVLHLIDRFPYPCYVTGNTHYLTASLAFQTWNYSFFWLFMAKPVSIISTAIGFACWLKILEWTFYKQYLKIWKFLWLNMIHCMQCSDVSTAVFGKWNSTNLNINVIRQKLT